MTVLSAQEVFMVFYAILYGTTLGNLNNYISFPWGNINEKSRRSFWRVILSILVLNVLPFFYFLGMMFVLKSQRLYLSNLCDFIFALLVLLSALGVFAFYRIYHLIFHWDEHMHWFWPNLCEGKPCELKKEDKKYIDTSKCESEINDCWTYIYRKRNSHGFIPGHMLAVFIYLLPGSIIIDIQRIVIVPVSGFMLLGVIWALYKCEKEKGSQQEELKMKDIRVLKEELNYHRLWIAIFYSASLTGSYIWYQKKNTAVGLMAISTGLAFFVMWWAYKRKKGELEKAVK